MGINIFYLTSKTNLEQQVEKINTAFGEEGNGTFDWADLFTGEGGHFLNLREAITFPDDAAPWYVIFDGENEDLTMINIVDSKVDWRNILVTRVTPDQQIVFLKARN